MAKAYGGGHPADCSCPGCKEKRARGDGKMAPPFGKQKAKKAKKKARGK